MNDGAVSNQDSPDLQALFDSIVAANEPPAPRAASAPPDGGADKEAVLSKIGRLTRTLHDGLRELGLDRILKDAAARIPDTRARLDYVIELTEKAAERALTATETARPVQDALEAEARALSAQWDRLFNQQLSIDEFKALVGSTRSYLSGVPARTGSTRAQLTEIMMAQDFQDLTGQVIKKVTETAHEVERHLVALLVEEMPQSGRAPVESGLNGPVITAAGRSDVLTSQDQVDELLESLGF